LNRHGGGGCTPGCLTTSGIPQQIVAEINALQLPG